MAEVTLQNSVAALLKEVEDKKLTVLLPINWVDGNNINLSVSIPEGFKPLQPPSDWENAMIIEFIPKAETADEWSEIITLLKIVGKKVPASFLTDMLKSGFKNSDPNLTIWLEGQDKNSNYEISNLGLSYRNNGVLEVFGSENYSGPVDCVGVQYTIRSKNGEEKLAIEKIKNFLKTNAQVVNAKK